MTTPLTGVPRNYSRATLPHAGACRRGAMGADYNIMPAAGAPLKAHSPRPKAHCYSTNVAPSRALSPCRQRRRDAKRRLQHNALQALQIKPSFERGCPVGAGDRMRQSRITSRKKQNTILAERVISTLQLSAEIVALRATPSSGAPRHLLPEEGFQK